MRSSVKTISIDRVTFQVWDLICFSFPVSGALVCCFCDWTKEDLLKPTKTIYWIVGRKKDIRNTIVIYEKIKNIWQPFFEENFQGLI